MKFVDPTGLEIYLMTGEEAAFHHGQGELYNEESIESLEREDGWYNWDVSKVYVTKQNEFLKTKVGGFFNDLFGDGNDRDLLGYLQMPTEEQIELYDLNPMDPDPIVMDLDGNFIASLDDLLEAENQDEIILDSVVLGGNLASDIGSVVAFVKALAAGGVKAAAFSVGESMVTPSTSTVTGLLDEPSESNALGEFFLSLIPFYGTYNSIDDLVWEDANDVKGWRDAFEKFDQVEQDLEDIENARP